MNYKKILFPVIFCLFTIQFTFASQGGFTAYLTGMQEAPPIITNARGTASVNFKSANSISFIITVNGLSGPITGSHFHIGPIGVAGPVVRNITTNYIGNTAAGTWDNIPDSLMKALMTEKLYLNVHTAANPGGEIRGQLYHSAGTGLSANMTSFQEVPSLNLNAKGTASMTLMESGLSFRVTVTGLTGPITAAHFHWGPRGVSGPVIKPITADFIGNTAEGVWRTTGTGALNDSLIAGLLTGKIYINVHTAANPGGEVRGQVESGTGFGFSASINGLFEVPPVITFGSGSASFTLTDAGLIYKITVNDLTGPIVGAHFHNAAFGSNGPIVKTINVGSGLNKTFTGIWKPNDAEPLTQELMSELINGRIYVNFHTAANPGGEIRGQVAMLPAANFSSLLEGNQETPPVVTPARGVGTFALSHNNFLAFQITVEGLTESITGAHFHYGASGQAGPILKEITASFTGNTAIGVWKIVGGTSDSIIKAIREGKIYVNVHTVTYPNGLIRGQVLHSDGTNLSAILEGRQETPPVTTNGKGVASLTLTPEGIVYDVTVNGLSGPITGAHFHYSPIGVAGPIIKDISPDIQGNHIQGLWSDLNKDSLYTALVTGKLYLNVHTAANPGGEIRGQILLGEGFAFPGQIDGQQETPPVNTPGKGAISASLTDGGLIFFSSVDSLLGNITVVHFHNAPAGVSGPIVKNLTPFFDDINKRNISGVWRINDKKHFASDLMSALLLDNIYINWHTNLYPHGEIRGQLLKDGMLSLEISKINENVNSKQYSLNQNFPNPFNPLTTIRFTIPHSSVVKLLLYDILGREVFVLVNKEMKAGTYDYQFDASNLSSGIYFYKLETPGFTDIKKMVLIK